nr:hypothetical protein CTI12_AA531400 [Tanacetum cinerariifolium]
MEKIPRLADQLTKGVRAVGIQTISKSIFRSMMVSWIQMNSWSGYEQWNGSLITSKRLRITKMKAKMKQKFLPTYYVQNSFSQLHSLRQRTGTAEEYSREFEYLLMKCDVPEDDPQTPVRYLGGLEPRVANVETAADRGGNDGGEVAGRGSRWPAAAVKGLEGFLKCERGEGV